jgi:pre-mRNA-processing factor 6
VYGEIDRLMRGRRKRSREAVKQEEAARQRADRPRITDQFADLKASLGQVSAMEWDAIPDAADGSQRLKARRAEQFMPVPDNIISSAAGMAAGQYANTEQGAGAASTITGLSQARGQVMALQLDSRSDSVAGQTVVDPTGYLTGLDTVAGLNPAEVGDVKRGRALMKSMIASNPSNALAWVSAARFEEHVRKPADARRI